MSGGFAAVAGCRSRIGDIFVGCVADDLAGDLLDGAANESPTFGEREFRMLINKNHLTVTRGIIRESNYL
jgi:hypothetical protein